MPIAVASGRLEATCPVRRLSGRWGCRAVPNGRRVHHRSECGALTFTPFRKDAQFVPIAGTLEAQVVRRALRIDAVDRRRDERRRDGVVQVGARLVAVTPRHALDQSQVSSQTATASATLTSQSPKAAEGRHTSASGPSAGGGAAITSPRRVIARQRLAGRDHGPSRLVAVPAQRLDEGCVRGRRGLTQLRRIRGTDRWATTGGWQTY